MGRGKYLPKIIILLLLWVSIVSLRGFSFKGEAVEAYNQKNLEKITAVDSLNP